MTVAFRITVVQLRVKAAGLSSISGGAPHAASPFLGKVRCAFYSDRTAATSSHTSTTNDGELSEAWQLRRAAAKQAEMRNARAIAASSAGPCVREVLFLEDEEELASDFVSDVDKVVSEVGDMTLIASITTGEVVNWSFVILAPEKTTSGAAVLSSLSSSETEHLVCEVIDEDFNTTLKGYMPLMANHGEILVLPLQSRPTAHSSYHASGRLAHNDSPLPQSSSGDMGGGGDNSSVEGAPASTDPTLELLCKVEACVVPEEKVQAVLARLNSSSIESFDSVEVDSTSEDGDYEEDEEGDHDDDGNEGSTFMVSSSEEPSTTVVGDTSTMASEHVASLLQSTGNDAVDAVAAAAATDEEGHGSISSADAAPLPFKPSAKMSRSSSLSQCSETSSEHARRAAAPPELQPDLLSQLSPEALATVAQQKSGGTRSPNNSHGSSNNKSSSNNRSSNRSGQRRKRRSSGSTSREQRHSVSWSKNNNASRDTPSGSRGAPTMVSTQHTFSSAEETGGSPPKMPLSRTRRHFGDITVPLLRSVLHSSESNPRSPISASDTHMLDQSKTTDEKLSTLHSSRLLHDDLVDHGVLQEQQPPPALLRVDIRAGHSPQDLIGPRSPSFLVAPVNSIGLSGAQACAAEASVVEEPQQRMFEETETASSAFSSSPSSSAPLRSSPLAGGRVSASNPQHDNDDAGRQETRGKVSTVNTSRTLTKSPDSIADVSHRESNDLNSEKRPSHSGEGHSGESHGSTTALSATSSTDRHGSSGSRSSNHERHIGVPDVASIPPLIVDPRTLTHVEGEEEEEEHSSQRSALVSSGSSKPFASSEEDDLDYHSVGSADAGDNASHLNTSNALLPFQTKLSSSRGSTQGAPTPVRSIRFGIPGDAQVMGDRGTFNNNTNVDAKKEDESTTFMQSVSGGSVSYHEQGGRSSPRRQGEYHHRSSSTHNLDRSALSRSRSSSSFSETYSYTTYSYSSYSSQGSDSTGSSNWQSPLRRQNQEVCGNSGECEGRAAVRADLESLAKAARQQTANPAALFSAYEEKAPAAKRGPKGKSGGKDQKAAQQQPTLPQRSLHSEERTKLPPTSGAEDAVASASASKASCLPSCGGKKAQGRKKRGGGRLETELIMLESCTPFQITKTPTNIHPSVTAPSQTGKASNVLSSDFPRPQQGDVTSNAAMDSGMLKPEGSSTLPDENTSLVGRGSTRRQLALRMRQLLQNGSGELGLVEGTDEEHAGEMSDGGYASETNSKSKSRPKKETYTEDDVDVPVDEEEVKQERENAAATAADSSHGAETPVPPISDEQHPSSPQRGSSDVLPHAASTTLSGAAESSSLIETNSTAVPRAGSAAAAASGALPLGTSTAPEEAGAMPAVTQGEQDSTGAGGIAAEAADAHVEATLPRLFEFEEELPRLFAMDEELPRLYAMDEELPRLFASDEVLPTLYAWDYCAPLPYLYAWDAEAPRPAALCPRAAPMSALIPPDPKRCFVYVQVQGLRRLSALLLGSTLERYSSVAARTSTAAARAAGGRELAARLPVRQTAVLRLALYDADGACVSAGSAFLLSQFSFGATIGARDAWSDLLLVSPSSSSASPVVEFPSFVSVAVERRTVREVSTPASTQPTNKGDASAPTKGEKEASEEAKASASEAQSASQEEQGHAEQVEVEVRAVAAPLADAVDQDEEKEEWVSLTRSLSPAASPQPSLSSSSSSVSALLEPPHARSSSDSSLALSSFHSSMQNSTATSPTTAAAAAVAIASSATIATTPAEMPLPPVTASSSTVAQEEAEEGAEGGASAQHSAEEDEQPPPSASTHSSSPPSVKETQQQPQTGEAILSTSTSLSPAPLQQPHIVTAKDESSHAAFAGEKQVYVTHTETVWTPLAASVPIALETLVSASAAYMANLYEEVLTQASIAVKGNRATDLANAGVVSFSGIPVPLTATREACLASPPPPSAPFPNQDGDTASFNAQANIGWGSAMAAVLEAAESAAASAPILSMGVQEGEVLLYGSLCATQSAPLCSPSSLYEMTVPIATAIQHYSAQATTSLFRPATGEIGRAMSGGASSCSVLPVLGDLGCPTEVGGGTSVVSVSSRSPGHRPLLRQQQQGVLATPPVTVLWKSMPAALQPPLHDRRVTAALSESCSSRVSFSRDFHVVHRSCTVVVRCTAAVLERLPGLPAYSAPPSWERYRNATGTDETTVPGPLVALSVSSAREGPLGSGASPLFVSQSAAAMENSRGPVVRFDYSAETTLSVTEDAVLLFTVHSAYSRDVLLGQATLNPFQLNNFGEKELPSQSSQQDVWLPLYGACDAAAEDTGVNEEGKETVRTDGERARKGKKNAKSARAAPMQQRTGWLHCDFECTFLTATEDALECLSNQNDGLGALDRIGGGNGSEADALAVMDVCVVAAAGLQGGFSVLSPPHHLQPSMPTDCNAFCEVDVLLRAPLLQDGDSVSDAEDGRSAKAESATIASQRASLPAPYAPSARSASRAEEGTASLVAAAAAAAAAITHTVGHSRYPRWQQRFRLNVAAVSSIVLRVFTRDTDWSSSARGRGEGASLVGSVMLSAHVLARMIASATDERSVWLPLSGVLGDYRGALLISLETAGGYLASWWSAMSFPQMSCLTRPVRGSAMTLPLECISLPFGKGQRTLSLSPSKDIHTASLDALRVGNVRVLWPWLRHVHRQRGGELHMRVRATGNGHCFYRNWRLISESDGKNDCRSFAYFIDTNCSISSSGRGNNILAASAQGTVKEWDTDVQVVMPFVSCIEWEIALTQYQSPPSVARGQRQQSSATGVGVVLGRGVWRMDPETAMRVATAPLCVEEALVALTPLHSTWGLAKAEEEDLELPHYVESGLLRCDIMPIPRVIPFPCGDDGANMAATAAEIPETGPPQQDEGESSAETHIAHEQAEGVSAVGEDFRWRWPRPGVVARLQLSIVDCIIFLDVSLAAPTGVVFAEEEELTASSENLRCSLHDLQQTILRAVNTQPTFPLAPVNTPSSGGDFMRASSSKAEKSLESAAQTCYQLQWPARLFSWFSRYPPSVHMIFTNESSVRASSTSPGTAEMRSRTDVMGVVTLQGLEELNGSKGEVWLPMYTPFPQPVHIGFVRAQYKHNFEDTTAERKAHRDEHAFIVTAPEAMWSVQVEAVRLRDDVVCSSPHSVQRESFVLPSSAVAERAGCRAYVDEEGCKAIVGLDAYQCTVDVSCCSDGSHKHTVLFPAQKQQVQSTDEAATASYKATLRTQILALGISNGAVTEDEERDEGGGTGEHADISTAARTFFALMELSSSPTSGDLLDECKGSNAEDSAIADLSSPRARWVPLLRRASTGCGATPQCVGEVLLRWRLLTPLCPALLPHVGEEGVEGRIYRQLWHGGAMQTEMIMRSGAETEADCFAVSTARASHASVTEEKKKLTALLLPDSHLLPMCVRGPQYLMLSQLRWERPAGSQMEQAPARVWAVVRCSPFNAPSSASGGGFVDQTSWSSDAPQTGAAELDVVKWPNERHYLRFPLLDSRSATAGGNDGSGDALRLHVSLYTASTDGAPLTAASTSTVTPSDAICVASGFTTYIPRGPSQACAVALTTEGGVPYGRMCWWAQVDAGIMTTQSRANSEREWLSQEEGSQRHEEAMPILVHVRVSQLLVCGAELTRQGHKGKHISVETPRTQSERNPLPASAASSSSSAASLPTVYVIAPTQQMMSSTHARNERTFLTLSTATLTSHSRNGGAETDGVDSAAHVNSDDPSRAEDESTSAGTTHQWDGDLCTVVGADVKLYVTVPAAVRELHAEFWGDAGAHRVMSCQASFTLYSEAFSAGPGQEEDKGVGEPVRKAEYFTADLVNSSSGEWVGRCTCEVTQLATTHDVFDPRTIFCHRVASLKVVECVGLVSGDVAQLQFLLNAYDGLRRKATEQRARQGRVTRRLRDQLKVVYGALRRAAATLHEDTAKSKDGTTQLTLKLDFLKNGNTATPGSLTQVVSRFFVPPHADALLQSLMHEDPTIAKALRRRRAQQQQQQLPSSQPLLEAQLSVTNEAPVRLDVTLHARQMRCATVGSGAWTVHPRHLADPPCRESLWLALATYGLQEGGEARQQERRLTSAGEVEKGGAAKKRVALVRAEASWQSTVCRGKLRLSCLRVVRGQKEMHDNANFSSASSQHIMLTPDTYLRVVYRFNVDGSEQSQYIRVWHPNARQPHDYNGWSLDSATVPRVGVFGGCIERVDLVVLVPIQKKKSREVGTHKDAKKAEGFEKQNTEEERDDDDATAAAGTSVECVCLGTHVWTTEDEQKLFAAVTNTSITASLQATAAQRGLWVEFANGARPTAYRALLVLSATLAPAMGYQLQAQDRSCEGGQDQKHSKEKEKKTAGAAVVVVPVEIANVTLRVQKDSITPRDTSAPRLQDFTFSLEASATNTLAADGTPLDVYYATEHLHWRSILSPTLAAQLSAGSSGSTETVEATGESNATLTKEKTKKDGERAGEEANTPPLPTGPLCVTWCPNPESTDNAQRSLCAMAWRYDEMQEVAHVVHLTVVMPRGTSSAAAAQQPSPSPSQTQQEEAQVLESWCTLEHLVDASASVDGVLSTVLPLYCRNTETGVLEGFPMGSMTVQWRVQSPCECRPGGDTYRGRLLPLVRRSEELDMEVARDSRPRFKGELEECVVHRLFNGVSPEEEQKENCRGGLSLRAVVDCETAEALMQQWDEEAAWFGSLKDAAKRLEKQRRRSRAARAWTVVGIEVEGLHLPRAIITTHSSTRGSRRGLTGMDEGSSRTLVVQHRVDCASKAESLCIADGIAEAAAAQPAPPQPLLCQIVFPVRAPRSKKSLLKKAQHIHKRRVAQLDKSSTEGGRDIIEEGGEQQLQQNDTPYQGEEKDSNTSTSACEEVLGVARTLGIPCDEEERLPGGPPLYRCGFSPLTWSVRYKDIASRRVQRETHLTIWQLLNTSAPRQMSEKAAEGEEEEMKTYLLGEVPMTEVWKELASFTAQRDSEAGAADDDNTVTAGLYRTAWLPVSPPSVTGSTTGPFTAASTQIGNDTQHARARLYLRPPQMHTNSSEDVDSGAAAAAALDVEPVTTHPTTTTAPKSVTVCARVERVELIFCEPHHASNDSCTSAGDPIACPALALLVAGPDRSQPALLASRLLLQAPEVEPSFSADAAGPAPGPAPALAPVAIPTPVPTAAVFVEAMPVEASDTITTSSPPEEKPDASSTAETHDTRALDSEKTGEEDKKEEKDDDDDFESSSDSLPDSTPAASPILSDDITAPVSVVPVAAAAPLPIAVEEPTGDAAAMPSSPVAAAPATTGPIPAPPLLLLLPKKPLPTTMVPEHAVLALSHRIKTPAGSSSSTACLPDTALSLSLYIAQCVAGDGTLTEREVECLLGRGELTVHVNACSVERQGIEMRVAVPLLSTRDREENKRSDSAATTTTTMATTALVTMFVFLSSSSAEVAAREMFEAQEEHTMQPRKEKEQQRQSVEEGSAHAAGLKSSVCVPRSHQLVECVARDVRDPVTFALVGGTALVLPITEAEVATAPGAVACTIFVSSATSPDTQGFVMSVGGLSRSERRRCVTDSLLVLSVSAEGTLAQHTKRRRVEELLRATMAARAASYNTLLVSPLGERSSWQWLPLRAEEEEGRGSFSLAGLDSLVSRRVGHAVVMYRDEHGEWCLVVDGGVTYDFVSAAAAALYGNAHLVSPASCTLFSDSSLLDGKSMSNRKVVALQGPLTPSARYYRGQLRPGESGVYHSATREVYPTSFCTSAAKRSDSNSSALLASERDRKEEGVGEEVGQAYSHHAAVVIGSCVWLLGGWRLDASGAACYASSLVSLPSCVTAYSTTSKRKKQRENGLVERRRREVRAAAAAMSRSRSRSSAGGRAVHRMPRLPPARILPPPPSSTPSGYYCRDTMRTASHHHSTTLSSTYAFSVPGKQQQQQQQRGSSEVPDASLSSDIRFFNLRSAALIPTLVRPLAPLDSIGKDNAMEQQLSDLLVPLREGPPPFACHVAMTCGPLIFVFGGLTHGTSHNAEGEEKKGEGVAECYVQATDEVYVFHTEWLIWFRHAKLQQPQLERQRWSKSKGSSSRHIWPSARYGHTVAPLADNGRGISKTCSSYVMFGGARTVSSAQSTTLSSRLVPLEDTVWVCTCHANGAIHWRHLQIPDDSPLQPVVFPVLRVMCLSSSSGERDGAGAPSCALVVSGGSCSMAAAVRSCGEAGKEEADAESTRGSAFSEYVERWLGGAAARTVITECVFE